MTAQVRYFRATVGDELHRFVRDRVSQPLLQPVCRNADDDAVLACAHAAQADFIASGDQDLLVLQRFEGIPIVTAAQTLERLGFDGWPPASKTLSI